jgi:hypothetical protein
MYPNCQYIDLIIDGHGTNNSLFTVADALTAGGENIVVKGCVITDAPDSGIMFTFPEGGLCTGNIVNGCRDIGIYINDNETGTSNYASTTSNNILIDCPFGGISLKRSVRGHFVTGNYIYSCGNGITHEYFGTGLGGWPEQCLISDNYIYKCGYPHRSATLVEVGIFLGKFDNGVCRNNYIYDVSGNGISCDGENFTINNNTIVSSSLANASPTTSNNRGINIVNRATFPLSYGFISDNNVSGFRDQALILSCGSAVVNGGVYKSTDSAFEIAQCTDCHVSDGYFYSTDAGFYLREDANNVVADNCTSYGASSAFALFSGSTYTIRDCVDLLNEVYDYTITSGMPKSKNSGIATITGTTGVEIAHGLRSAPTKFSLHASTDSYWWVEVITTTACIFRTTTAGDYTLYWQVEC